MMKYLTALLAATTIVMARPRVLVFTATTGYRHGSIPDSIAALQARSDVDQVDFEFTEDPGMFTTDGLGRFDGLMFVSTTGEKVLNENQAQAFHTYLQQGGNFVGVHAATDCLGGEDWYVQTTGARFDYHPDLQPATFVPLNKTHPSTSMLPDRWTFTEEVYYFRSDPRDNGVEVVLTVDESSYTDDLAGSDGSTGDYDQGVPHPIAWYHTQIPGAQPLTSSAPGPGRAFYTSLGHLKETWADPVFMDHVMGGLGWALDSGSTRWTNGTTALVGQVQEQSSSTSASSTMEMSPTGTASGTATMTSGTSTTPAAAGTSTSVPANAGQKDGSMAGKTAVVAGAIVGAMGLML